MPEKETIGIIKDLHVDAIIGLNLIEKYNITLEKERASFREYQEHSYYSEKPPITIANV